MSAGVGELLGLEEGSELLETARCRWDEWSAADVRLRVVAGYDELRPWLLEADYDAIDDVLLALAELAAPDGGDDVAAAGVLAKCLLPGACRLAGCLSRRQREQPFRDNQSTGGTGSARINELVASQLWIEIRTVGWQRIRRVAANILLNTRAAVLLELGDHFQVERRDRSWARTFVTDGAMEDVRPVAEEHGAGAPSELADLLLWAGESNVISRSDRQLLASLVEEAAAVDTRNLRRGCGGLMSNELSRRVAARTGVSESTVRRHTSRTLRALALAAPRFTDAN